MAAERGLYGRVAELATPSRLPQFKPVLGRTAARGEPGTTMATTAKRGRLRATAASYVLVRGVLKTSTQRLPRDMRVYYAHGCSRRGLVWHRPLARLEATVHTNVDLRCSMHQ